jgi:hypothetical protein
MDDGKNKAMRQHIIIERMLIQKSNWKDKEKRWKRNEEEW